MIKQSTIKAFELISKDPPRDQLQTLMNEAYSLQQKTASTKIKIVHANDIKGAILQGNVEHQEIKGTEWRIQGQRLVIVQDGLDMTELYSHDNQLSCSHVPTLTLLRRQTLSKANLEIVAYQLGLESIEAQLVVHQKNEAVYEEKVAVLEFEVKDKRLDDSVYRPTANKTSASVSQVEENITPPSNTSVEMPRVESVRPSGVIIKDWVSDDEDIFLSNDLQATDKPSFKIIEFTNARNESVKPKQADKPRIITQNPKVDRRDWNGQMTQKLRLGFGFTKKAYFFCGIYSHLIKDCDFHEKRMAKKSVLKNMGKNFGQREIRPVWNSAQRINHQNKFVPSAVLTRFGRVPVSAAKQSSLRATTSTSTFRPVNTATHTNRVNVSKLKTNAFHKSHSPIRRSFYKSTTPNTRISNEKVNTVRVNGVNTARQTTVSTVKGTGVTAVKASTGCVWRPKMTDLNNVSKDNSGSWVSKRGNPQQALKNKGIFDSGCSRHMIGNKDFLTDYQDIEGAQDNDNIIRTQTTIMPNVDIPQGMDTCGSPRCQETMGGTPAQTRSERVLAQPNEPPLSEGHTSESGEGRMENTFELTANVPITPHDSPLSGGYTPGSDEGRLKLHELMTMCTKLSKQVLDLEKEKDAQAVEIPRLKKKVKRLERQRKSSTKQPRRRKYR
ncbi:hypothetical protein Tco_1370258 [Tanacetum coccineum]